MENVKKIAKRRKKKEENNRLSSQIQIIDYNNDIHNCYAHSATHSAPTVPTAVQTAAAASSPQNMISTAHTQQIGMGSQIIDHFFLIPPILYYTSSVLDRARARSRLHINSVMGNVHARSIGSLWNYDEPIP